MEKIEGYEVKKRLGKGAQGSVFLVEHENAKNGEKFVLKKVECNDESEANKAFKEAMALQELKHPYICGYKEFFVTWDKKESAMFVCIVMDHYANGDLDKVLKQKRAKKEPIEELIIKKWLGQMVEALVFVHKKKVIHRDLKPSNIFMKDDLGISLGDFGVATIMGDARTKTRTTVGSMNWMAPEVLERPYDERSDVWSAGCITLETATCGILDSQQQSGLLFEIKNNPQPLEETLEKITQAGYSQDLASVIRTMLRRNFKQRPTAKDLLDLPYIKDCLTLIKSELAERQPRIGSSIPKKPVPKGNGTDAVIKYLQENGPNEVSVQSALEYLVEITKEEGTVISKDGKKTITKAMRDHIKCVEVQIAGCNIINNLIVTAEQDDILYTNEIIPVIPLAMKSHSGSSQLQQSACAALMALSADEGAAEVIGNVGGVQDVLSAMRTFPRNSELCATCCNAIWSLSVTEGNAKIVTEEKGLQDVCNAMSNHSDNGDLIEAAAAALLSLSMEDDNMELVSDLDCVGLLIAGIEAHIGDAKVVKNACMALASLVEPDEESAFKVLSNNEVSGIPIVMKAYESHKDNAEVVENICTLFMELVEYDDICKDLISYNVPKMLKEIRKMFIKNEDVMAPCEAALTKLGGGKASNRPTSARNRPKSVAK
ncbi:unnamed protein product [Owenia fusiformis]|uniref:Serine/threonine kinase-like domain-containing protein STKLD1 n=1 Tax=Owenia fusiformis TaxID=6347 RepID=A0A8J1TXL2_OWEFU|nr:unnamed protein product [Owenia fusiformis]